MAMGGYTYPYGAYLGVTDQSQMDASVLLIIHLIAFACSPTVQFLCLCLGQNPGL